MEVSLYKGRRTEPIKAATVPAKKIIKSGSIKLNKPAIDLSTSFL